MNQCYLLGIKYDINSEKEYKKFIRDFRSHILMSYRYNFIKLVPSLLTSDIGWGCMIRSGQMILAESLLRNKLGREWRFENLNGEKNYSLAHKSILEYFLDIPNIVSYFSIHNIIQIGLKYNMKPGDWYGPETISYVLRDLVNSNILIDLSIYVSFNSMIIKKDIMEICKKKKNFKFLLLIPLRLGLNTINDLYINSLLSFFEFPQSVGIIGGKSKYSLYFIGYENKQLKYLDPHTSKSKIDNDIYFPKMNDLLSYHSMNPLSIDISEIDPSLTIGFFIKDENDFNDFLDRINNLFKNNVPVFEIKDSYEKRDISYDSICNSDSDWEVLSV